MLSGNWCFNLLPATAFWLSNILNKKIRIVILRFKSRIRLRVRCIWYAAYHSNSWACGKLGGKISYFNSHSKIESIPETIAHQSIGLYQFWLCWLLISCWISIICKNSWTRNCFQKYEILWVATIILATSFLTQFWIDFLLSTKQPNILHIQHPSSTSGSFPWISDWCRHFQNIPFLGSLVD